MQPSAPLDLYREKKMRVYRDEEMPRWKGPENTRESGRRQ